MVDILVIFVLVPSILLPIFNRNDGNEKDISTNHPQRKIHSSVSRDKSVR